MNPGKPFWYFSMSGADWVRMERTDWKKKVYFLAALAVPAVLLAVVFYRGGIFPFGDRSLVYHDMQYQYVDFFMWLHKVLHGEEALGYSFTYGLGGSTIAFFAYYLASPFNLLLYFVEQEDIAQFLTLLIGLKLVLCGGASYIYVRKRFDVEPFYGILFAVSYCFMGYNVLQCSNIMWLDGVIVLPLIALGIYGLIWEKKKALYFWTLFYGIISNWYIGYMLCLFAVLYYIFEYVLYWWEKRRTWTEAGKDLLGFAGASILSAGATGILFIPQALYMMKEGRNFDWTIFKPAWWFSFLAGFRDFFLEPDKLTISAASPPVYIGSFVLLLTVCMFLSKKVEAKKKYMAAVFLLGLMFALQYKPVGYVFTALQVPASHFYRYTFLFSFFMIAFSAMFLKDIGRPEGKVVRNGVALIILVGLFFDYIQPYEAKEKVYLSFLALTVIGICFWLAGKSRREVIVAANMILALCLLCEFYEKMQTEFEDHEQSVSAYVEYNQIMQGSVDKRKEEDPDGWRMDKTFTRTVWCGSNESMAFGYSSPAQYSSTNNRTVAEGLQGLGYTGDPTTIPYRAILPADSILGVKYIYTRSQVPEGELIEEGIMEDVSLYRNPYALPIGYRAKEAVEESGYGINVMENQEQFFSRILGRPVALYTDAEILSMNQDGAGNATYEVKAGKSGPLYCYFTNNRPYMTVLADGKRIKWMEWYDKCQLYLGRYEAGESVKIQVKPGEGIPDDYGLCVGTLDMEELQEATEEIRQDALYVLEMEKGVFRASYTGREEASLLLTIPYEDGWKVKVNGQAAEYARLEGMFIGIDVPAGESTIEMVYETPGQTAGILVSAASIMLFYVWEYIRKRPGSTRI